MALMELSDGFITSGMENGYTKRLINGYDSSMSRRGLITAPGVGGSGVLLILKGTVPANFTGLTNWSSRSSDVLLQLNRPISGEILVSFPGNNTCLISTIFKNASASGTASWFWLMATDGNGGSTDGISQQMIGTVGTQGSGADMEISSTNVVAGSPYRVISSQITLPISWTY